MRRDPRAGGEGAGERAREGEGCATERATRGWGRRKPSPRLRPGRCAPQAPLRPSARLRTRELHTTSPHAPCPGSPLAQRSPSAPRRRLRPHVTLAPLFPRCRLAGTCLSLGARPFACSASLAASPCSSFSLVAASIPPQGDTPFLSSACFFPADARRPPVRTGGQPFCPSSRGFLPAARSGSTPGR